MAKKGQRKSRAVREPSEQYDTHRQALRENTRFLLESRGITQRQFAAALHCAQSYVNIILNRDEELNFLMMCNVADVLGVPVLLLMTPGAFSKASNPRTPRKAS